MPVKRSLHNAAEAQASVHASIHVLLIYEHFDPDKPPSLTPKAGTGQRKQKVIVQWGRSIYRAAMEP